MFTQLLDRTILLFSFSVQIFKSMCVQPVFPSYAWTGDNTDQGQRLITVNGKNILFISIHPHVIEFNFNQFTQSLVAMS